MHKNVPALVALAASLGDAGPAMNLVAPSASADGPRPPRGTGRRAGRGRTDRNRKPRFGSKLARRIARKGIAPR